MMSWEALLNEISLSDLNAFKTKARETETFGIYADSIQSSRDTLFYRP